MKGKKNNWNMANLGTVSTDIEPRDQKGNISRLNKIVLRTTNTPVAAKSQRISHHKSNNQKSSWDPKGLMLKTLRKENSGEQVPYKQTRQINK